MTKERHVDSWVQGTALLRELKQLIERHWEHVSPPARVTAKLALAKAFCEYMISRERADRTFATGHYDSQRTFLSTEIIPKIDRFAAGKPRVARRIIGHLSWWVSMSAHASFIGPTTDNATEALRSSL